MTRETTLGTGAVRLTADATALDRGLDRARAKTKQFTADADKSLTPTRGRFEALSRAVSPTFENAMAKASRSTAAFGAALGKLNPLLLGLGSALTVGGLAALTSNALSAADAVGKAADRAGAGVTEFQRLRFAAELGAVSAEQLEKSLAMLNKRMSEGKVAGESTEAAFLAIADQVRNATTETERAAIVNAAFGEEGRRLLPMLKNGAAGIRELGDEAERLGLVLDEKTVRNAEALNDELSRLSSVVSSNVSAGLLAGLVGETESLRDVYADPSFRDGLRDFGAFVGDTLGFLVRNAETVIRVTRALAAVYIGAKVGGAIGGGRGALIGAGVGAGVAGIVELLRESADDVELSLGRINTALTDFGSGAAVDVGGAEDAVKKLLERLSPAAAATNAYIRDLEALEKAERDGRLTTEQRMAAIDKLGRATFAARKPLEALHEELANEVAVLGMSESARATHNRMLEIEARLRAAGIDLTDEQRRKIEAEIDVIVARTAAQEKAAKATEDLDRKMNAARERAVRDAEKMVDDVTDYIASDFEEFPAAALADPEIGTELERILA